MSFEASTLRDDAGAEIPVDQIVIEQASLTLSRGQRVVQAAITIPVGANEGSTYLADMRVKGHKGSRHRPGGLGQCCGVDDRR